MELIASEILQPHRQREGHLKTEKMLRNDDHARNLWRQEGPGWAPCGLRQAEAPHKDPGANIEITVGMSICSFKNILSGAKYLLSTEGRKKNIVGYSLYFQVV